MRNGALFEEVCAIRCGCGGGKPHINEQPLSPAVLLSQNGTTVQFLHAHVICSQKPHMK